MDLLEFPPLSSGSISPSSFNIFSSRGQCSAPQFRLKSASTWSNIEFNRKNNRTKMNTSVFSGIISGRKSWVTWPLSQFPDHNGRKSHSCHNKPVLWNIYSACWSKLFHEIITDHSLQALNDDVTLQSCGHSRAKTWQKKNCAQEGSVPTLRRCASHGP